MMKEPLHRHGTAGICARQEPEILRATANARINWVLNHPHMSDWLKAALRSANGVDPVAIQNDMEILRQLIGLRAEAEMAAWAADLETARLERAP